MVWIKLVLKAFLFPPGIFFLLLLIALILKLRRKIWQSNAVLVCSLLGFYLLSTPRVAYFLISPLEEKISPLPEKFDAQAIVILGGGQKDKAPEYGMQSIVTPSTLMRIAYGAFLQRKTALPVLVSGGKVLDETVSEAKVMEDTLLTLFTVPTRWKEEQSQTTAENASYSYELLKNAGIKKILLVTEAWHMRRAALAFSSTGLELIPAPTNFQNPPSHTFKNWLPNSESLKISTRALHEWLGYIWYRIVIP